VSNALGVVTNQQGYWNPAFFDTNALDFTTNAFQCYDIRLTNGLNTITLHATDMAGNSITTNVSLTLDYASDTTPPALSILWPQDGTLISGSNFTLQAQVDDATATITASIANTNGNTNIVRGLVERDGTVWVQNLPLAAGTNTLTITATDAADNSTAANLTLVQSGVLVTMDPLNQFNQSFVTVTGTISNPSYDVWVNGVEAYYVDDAGGWEADGVPVSPTGTATFDVEIYAGDSVLVCSQKFSQAQPAVISLMSYMSRYDSDATWYYGCLDGPLWGTTDETVNWLYKSGGVDSKTDTGLDGDCQPVSSSPPTILAGGYNGYSPAWEIKNVAQNFYYPPYWCYVAAPANKWVYIKEYGLVSLSEDAYARVMIVPSGHAVAGQTAFYLVSAQVMNEDSGLQVPGNELQIRGTTLTDVTNDDGSVWSGALVSAPAGVQAEVTPKASVQNISYSGMQVYQLVSHCVANVPVDDTRTNIGVGEQVVCSMVPELTVGWSANGGSVSLSSGVQTTFTAPSNAANVTVTATIGGMPINLYFKVFAPTGYVSALIASTENNGYYGAGNAGAGMYLFPIIIGPTNVSFGRVSIIEIGEVATNATGYFANTNTSPADLLNHSTHGANVWRTLNEDNSIAAMDHATSGTCNPPWSSGSFTWPIPVGWHVGENSLVTNVIPGWSQTFLIDASGTVTIQKFGHSVTRTTNDVITTQ
jgi:hypothetical protein